MGIVTTIDKYERQLSINPSSRVFAPLAEAYRKSGMVEKALQILSQNIKKHPSYISGFLVLAHCYFDLEKYDKAYEILDPIAVRHLENIQLQRLYAQVCFRLGYREQALEKYKYLLFLNPKDVFIQNQLRELEEKNPILKSSKSERGSEIKYNLFNEEMLEHSPPVDIDKDLGGWVRVDLKGDDEVKNFEPVELKNSKKLIDEEGEVLVESSAGEIKGAPVPPFMTHTLVDLYLVQGHIDKAAEVLEKIIALNPEDSRSIARLDEIRKNYFFSSTEQDDRVEDVNREDFSSEQSDREELMNLIDRKVKKDPSKHVKDLFWKFHERLVDHSKTLI